MKVAWLYCCSLLAEMWCLSVQEEKSVNGHQPGFNEMYPDMSHNKNSYFLLSVRNDFMTLLFVPPENSMTKFLQGGILVRASQDRVISAQG